MWDYGTIEGPAAEDWVVISESTGGATTFIMTDGFDPATVYYFKVRAINEFGEGPWSSAIRVVTASVPVQLAAPSSLVHDGINVKTTWAATSDTRGSAVTNYRVTFRGADGAFHIPNVAPNDAHACNRETTADAATTECSMPMAVLTSAPFNLEAGDAIVARV
jgi:hypothetical protein